MDGTLGGTKVMASVGRRVAAHTRWVLPTAASILLLCAGGAAADEAPIPSPAWTLDSFAAPTHFTTRDNTECEGDLAANEPVGCDSYILTVTNRGGLASDGSPVVITDVLPPGLDVQRVSLYWGGASRSTIAEGENLNSGGQLCTTSPLKCELPAVMAPDDHLTMVVNLLVPEPETPVILDNLATVVGGGAPEARVESANAIAPLAAPFGPIETTFVPTDVGGGVDTEAAAHPYEITTRINLANTVRDTPSGGVQGVENELGNQATSTQDLKDLVVDLPTGLLGSVTATPTCSLAQLGSAAGCPPSTIVGHLTTEPTHRVTRVSGPIYNLVPERGQAAEFGFTDALPLPHVIYAKVVPTPSGYALRVSSTEIPQVPLTSLVVTFFGAPAEKNGSGETPRPFLTNPAVCDGLPLVTTIHMDSWQTPGRFSSNGNPDFSDPHWVEARDESPPVTGCNRLHFPASITSQPDTTIANSSTGLNLTLAVGQNNVAGAPAVPPLRDAEITLPPGLTLNPSAAQGLTACTPAQIGWLGGSATNFSPEQPSCPEASKIATAEVQTPLLPNPLSGSVYLASQEDNPFGSLFAAYLVIDDPATGILVKVPGKLTLSESTGQITGAFDETPQLPFSDLKLRFFGGASRGELATPEQCGTYSTTSRLSPWSAPDSGPPATPGDTFSINSGCATEFAPVLSAGTASPTAGAYSAFSLSLANPAQDEDLKGLTLSLPPGLLADIAGIPLCSDAQFATAATNSGRAETANPSCSSASQIGTVDVAAGAGASPLLVAGKVYLGGSYKGAPYSLAVVVPAVAGPFDLGTVVVRVALYVDRYNAHITAVSDTFPTIIRGVPIRLRRVDLVLDRPRFTFNPTNCTATAITGIATSTSGQTSALESHFQVGGCRELRFAPKFAVSTQDKTSKANGASLHVRVVAGPGEANISSVHVTLPRQLPSRLSTLQKACPYAVFERNPAECAPGSDVGIATAITPVLATPLRGPAYLVSHGGAAFPDLIIVLETEGITLNLVGNTKITKGITTSTFNNAPDAPISSFELALLEGPHSLLTSNLPNRAHFRMCGQHMAMPTVIRGQNGALVTQGTKIVITGCPTAHTRRHPSHRPTRSRSHQPLHRQHR
jgi:uncharacterized repeat protein (TIGR01451 family)